MKFGFKFGFLGGGAEEVDCSLSVGDTDGTAFEMAGYWYATCIMFKA